MQNNLFSFCIYSEDWHFKMKLANAQFTWDIFELNSICAILSRLFHFISIKWWLIYVEIALIVTTTLLLSAIAIKNVYDFF